MDIKNEKNIENKTKTLSSSDLVEIELVLFPTIRLFHESNHKLSIMSNVRRFFIDYCIDRNLPLEETLVELNKLLPYGQQPKLTDFAPTSQSGQKHLVSTVLFPKLSEENLLFKKEKADETIENFCNFTRISPETAKPIINTMKKQRIKSFIENDIYDFFISIESGNSDAIGKNEQKKLILEESSKMLGVDKKYITRLISNKRKKESEKKSPSIPTIDSTSDDHDER